LERDEIRDKVLNGNIRKEDCDDDRMYQFLKLLKIPKRRQNQQLRKEITMEQ